MTENVTYAARPRYKWDEWFGKKRFVLRKGVDYFCSESAIVQQIRNNATDRKKYVHVQPTQGGVVVDVDHEVNPAGRSGGRKPADEVVSARKTKRK